jgi:hypothetical protein
MLSLLSGYVFFLFQKEKKNIRKKFKNKKDFFSGGGKNTKTRKNRSAAGSEVSGQGGKVVKCS